MWKRSYKALIIGIITGVIGPFIGAILFYFMKLNSVPFGEFVQMAARNPTFAVPLLSFGALVNLGFFFLFLQIDAPLASRGVIFVTLIFAFFVLIFKLFL